MKTITIEVSPTGEIKIETAGFKGADCEKATAAMEKALGVESGPKQRKPEYYQQQASSNTQRA